MNSPITVGGQFDASSAAATVPKNIVNLPNGESEVIFPSGLGAGSNVSFEEQFFSAANGTGTLVSYEINFTDGTSQEFSTQDLPNGAASLKVNFSGANETGAVTSTAFNFLNGTSQLSQLTGLPSNEIAIEKTFSGLNETGPVIEQAILFKDGSEQVTFFAGPHSRVAAGTLSIEQNRNSRGELVSNRIQLANGNVESDGFTYDAEGELLSEKVNIFNSKGQIISSSTIGASEQPIGNATQVTQLVSAMSSFNAPVAGSASVVQPQAATPHSLLVASAH